MPRRLHAPNIPTYAAVTWAAVLLPYLDRRDLWEGRWKRAARGFPVRGTIKHLRLVNWNPSPKTGAPWNQNLRNPQPNVNVRLATLVCPDDSYATAACALSYVVHWGNGAHSILQAGAYYPMNPVNENGVFRNLVPTNFPGGGKPLPLRGLSRHRTSRRHRKGRCSPNESLRSVRLLHAPGRLWDSAMTTPKIRRASGTRALSGHDPDARTALLPMDRSADRNPVNHAVNSDHLESTSPAAARASAAPWQRDRHAAGTTPPRAEPRRCRDCHVLRWALRQDCRHQHVRRLRLLGGSVAHWSAKRSRHTPCAVRRVLLRSGEWWLFD